METSNLESINDLIELANEYKQNKQNKKNKKRSADKQIKCNNDLERLVNCLEPLKKLNELIGMEEIKKNIIDQILFYCQKLNTDEMMHVCITGPPGVGKTTLIKILAELYCSMGFLESGEVHFATRDSLIGGYLGQTAIKTKKVLKNALHSTLVIDEIYSLGSGKDDNDSYSKECIDTINQFLSEHKKDILVIVAGYKEHVQNYFFNMNPGLDRRFPWRYEIVPYKSEQLKEIFKYQVKEHQWMFEESFDFSKLDTIFSQSEYFKNNGGSTEQLRDRCKIFHSKRVFGKSKKLKKKINFSDISLAFEQIKKQQQLLHKGNDPPYGIYL